MDATRNRRTRDGARERWYARWRSLRFARHFGFFYPKLSSQGGPPPISPLRRAG